MTREDQALVALIAALRTRGYHFVTPTPDTHRRVARRWGKRRAHDLRDVFGWSRPFRVGDIDGRIVELMRRAGVLEEEWGWARSTVRVASLAGDLLLHSAFPANAPDAVFFGPDTYRFADLLRGEISADRPAGRLVDLGSGAGAGAIAAARADPQARLALIDINPAAARLARINLAAAGLEGEVVTADGLSGVEGPIDTVIANPPYLSGSSGRTYRDGGDLLGARASLDWASAAVGRLATGGRLLMYTGSAIVDGKDAFHERLEPVLEAAGCDLAYREMDPDVFGGLLNHPAYWKVERVAAVAVVATRR
jgi:hypothetical protein